MKIGDLARRCGLSVHTLRYYERIGLLPPPVKNGSGHRDYDASILAWIGFLGRLKTTGMPIQSMLLYARLREQGPATAKARQTLLEEHRTAVKAHLAEVQASLAALDAKIDSYSRIEEMEHDASCPATQAPRPLRRGVGGARPH